MMRRMADENLCPCGSGRELDNCCLPAVRGEREPDTAEALMRSRYTAYVLGELDYIVETNHSSTRDEVDREEIERWSTGSDWLGLSILDTEAGGSEDAEGTVTFTARYRYEGTTHTHRERSRFERENSAWRFHSVLGDGTELDLVPVTASSTVGRNDPCPCGSGKKHKKCCGAAA